MMIPFAEIEQLARRDKPVEQQQLYLYLERLIQQQYWKALLIYAGLYCRKLTHTDLTAFFADRVIQSVNQAGQTANGMATSPEIRSSAILPLSARNTDHFLISMSFVVLAFDSKPLRYALRMTEKALARKLVQLESRFVDMLNVEAYLSILDKHYQAHQESFQPLEDFFKNLIADAQRLDNTRQPKMPFFQDGINAWVGEVGRKLEKTDRMFFTLGLTESIAESANQIFELQETSHTLYREKYQWVYNRDVSFKNLRLFWTACLYGLFTLKKDWDNKLAISAESDLKV